MQLRNQWLAAVVLAGAVALSGCAETASGDASIDEPATIEAVKGTDLSRVILTRKAVERLGVEMEVVREETQTGAAAPTRFIPYASVVYDPNGATWVYTSPEPLTFVRTAITIDDIDGERAVISAGPDVGTEVVTVGTAELYGTEQEIGH